MPVHLWIMCEGAAFLFESGKCLHKFLQKESKWPRNLWAWNVAKGRISWHLRRAMGLQLLFQRHYDVSWRWKVNQLCTLNYTTMFHFWFSIADWLFYMETWNVLCWATCSCSVGMFCWPFPLLSICWTDLLVQLTTEPTELTLKKNQPCLGGGGGGGGGREWSHGNEERHIPHTYKTQWLFRVASSSSDIFWSCKQPRPSEYNHTLGSHALSKCRTGVE